MALLRNSEQRLDNVNRTHLVLASGKLVLQKTTMHLRGEKSFGKSGDQTGVLKHRM